VIGEDGSSIEHPWTRVGVQYDPSRVIRVSHSATPVLTRRLHSPFSGQFNKAGIDSENLSERRDHAELWDLIACYIRTLDRTAKIPTALLVQRPLRGD